MLYLLIVSLVWAFSFGLVKNNLGDVSPYFVAAARLGISLIVFLPFFRWRGLDRKTALQLILIGAIQYGGMYIAYTYAFQYLKAFEVALFTIFTPLYVTLIHDYFQRRWNRAGLAAAFLAILGTAVVKVGTDLPSTLLAGFLVVQISNLCFAFGQVWYREVLADKEDVKDRHIFALPYLGGAAASGLAALLFTDWSTLVFTSSQGWTLLYLGAISSGLCFFLWNAGARKVDASTLAVFNDLKIPLAVVVSLVFFGEQANLTNLLIGSLIVMAALALSEWTSRRRQLQLSQRI